MKSAVKVKLSIIISILLLSVISVHIILTGPVFIGMVTDPGEVVSFTLVDAVTNLPIPGYNPIIDGATINLADLPTNNLNIRANTNPDPVGSVQFSYNEFSNFRIENNAPYTLMVDNAGDAHDWTPDTIEYVIQATPYSDSQAGGTSGIPLTIRITFIDDTPVAAITPGHPNTFINQQEIDAIKTKLSQEPWKSAYDEVISEANSALGQSLLSVTFQGSTSKDYYTQEPYDWSNNMPSPCGSTTCDGQINPLADRADYTAAIDLGRAVRNLGLAYAFTDNSQYADKAIELIEAWTIDSSSGMNPSYTNGQSKIELSITMPGLFYGADLIYNYPGWTNRDAFLAWTSSFVESAKGWSATNNFDDWRMVVISTGGALTDDDSDLDYALNRWNSNLATHIGSNGEMLKELGRTKSLFYSTYALLAITQTAEVLRHHNQNGYPSLEKAFDYHAPFVEDPSQWTWQQITPYQGENAALFEMAYLYNQKSAYIDAINKWNRPLEDIRVMGWVTLTHAEGAIEWTVWDDTVQVPDPEPTPEEPAEPVPEEPAEPVVEQPQEIGEEETVEALGGGGGGGAGGAIPCDSEWECDDWNNCIDGTKYRTCSDLNGCLNPVLESEECAVECVESCSDWSVCSNDKQTRSCSKCEESTSEERECISDPEVVHIEKSKPISEQPKTIAASKNVKNTSLALFVLTSFIIVLEVYIKKGKVPPPEEKKNNYKEAQEELKRIFSKD